MIVLQELIDALLMTAIVGYIFMDLFQPPRDVYDPFRIGFDWEAFKFACYVVAPAIIFHEIAHKVVALGFGLQAQFHAAYSWLFLGLLLKTLVGFVFFVPAYVSIQGVATPLASGLTAFAGPALNLLLWALAGLMLTRQISRRQVYFWGLTKRINGFLFLLNMLPVPGFDGSKVFNALLGLF